MSILCICVVFLCLVSFSGRVMFFLVVSVGNRWKFWNMKLILCVCSCVWVFLFSVFSDFLVRVMLLWLGRFSLVSRLSRVVLLEFEVLMIVMFLFLWMVMLMLFSMWILFFGLWVDLLILWVEMVMGVLWGDRLLMRIF